MLHKHAETDIFSYVVPTLYSRIISSQWAGINPVLDLPLIWVPRLTYKEPGHGKPLTHYVLRIFDRLFEEHFKVFIWGVVLITGVLPLDNGLSLPDGDVEEGVQEEDHVVFHGINVQKDGVRLLLV